VHNCLLKPLEEPSTGTMWIICSSEPSKFGATVGKAILSRCTQFILEPHSNSDLLKQAIRIAKGEKMNYVLTEDKSVLKSLVKNANGEMRTIGNLMQSLQQYYDGLEDAPEELTAKDLSEVIASTESSDDRLAVELMTSLYGLKFAGVQRALLDVTDQFMFVKKITQISSFLLNRAVVGKHSKIWWTAQNKAVEQATKDMKLSLGTLAAVNARLIKVHAQALTFQLPATDLLSSELYFLIKELAG